MTIVALTVTLFSIQKWQDIQGSLTQTGAPTTVLGILYALEWSELLYQPWNWFYLPSYLLTLFIFFALDSIAKEIREGGASPETRVTQMERLLLYANIRSVLTNIGLAVALWYFLEAVDAWEQVSSFVWGDS